MSHYGHTLEIYMPKFRSYNNVLVSATLVECVEYVHNSPPLTRHVQLPTIFHSCRLNRHLIVEDNYFHPYLNIWMKSDNRLFQEDLFTQIVEGTPWDDINFCF